MESIGQSQEKIKSKDGSKTSKWSKYWFFIVVVILVGTLSFALGRLVNIENSRPEVLIEYPDQEYLREYGGGELVGSKNGQVYHLPWCSGAQRISEENKIYFNSIEEAEESGYRPALNCPGI